MLCPVLYLKLFNPNILNIADGGKSGKKSMLFPKENNQLN